MRKTRKIVIGDIHGCYDELLALLEQIGPVSGDILIPAGDLIDRGPKSEQVMDFFASRPNTVAIMGNHERKHVRGILSPGQEISRRQFAARYNQAREVMAAFPYFYEDNDVIVVHAALKRGLPMPAQPEEILCGTMAGERQLARLLKNRPWFEEYRGEKPVIYGHKVVGKTPRIHNGKTFGIDTGACHGGWLTAITVPEFKIYSVKAKENYWSRIKQRGPQNV